MARVAVDVVIKSEILDPQGKAILAALTRTGHPGVSSVRQGKHFEIDLADDAAPDVVDRLADTLLANPVIEEFRIRR